MRQFLPDKQLNKLKFSGLICRYSESGKFMYKTINNLKPKYITKSKTQIYYKIMQIYYKFLQSVFLLDTILLRTKYQDT